MFVHVDDLLKDNIINLAWLEIEDQLVEMRDSRMFTLCGNGLVIRERDGSVSPTIRIRTDAAIRMALNIIIEELKKQNKIKELK